MTDALTKEQAQRVIAILNDECDARLGERNSYKVIDYVTRESWEAKEWRFCGALGWSGTLRIDTNRDHPYVDCAPEDETSERLAMIARANKRLAEIIIR
jgi:hypothetical protein